MMKNRAHPFHMVLCVCVALAACKERRLSVWDEYDVRYPVPAASQVPPTRATIYNRYNSDNDSYYTKPAGQFGSCSAEDIDEFSCD